MALPIMAQVDKRIGSSMTPIPGTSTVSMSPPMGLSAQPMSGGYLMSPMTVSAQPAAGSYSQSAPAKAQAPSDTVYMGTAGKLPEEEKPAYPAPMSTYYNGGWLHQGLNVSLDLSVFAQFGKNAPSGAGFGQRLTATWLQPLGKRAWLAAGGYVNHVNYDGASITSGGLYGELGYQFNEHWSGNIYGQKSIVNSGLNGVSPYYYGRGFYGLSPMMYNQLGDKLGAALRWTPNKTFSLEVSVERNWYPNNNSYYASPVPTTTTPFRQ
jgi:hypothetical protein